MPNWVDRRTTRRAVWRAKRQAPPPRFANLLIGIILLACLVAVYAYMRWSAGPQITMAGKAWVIDGDTIEISGTRIRLEGIDAPELDQTCIDRQGKAWPCGRAASSELRTHMHGRDLTCNATGRDKYQRVLAVCLLPDGAEINAWMVRQGWALAYGFANKYASEQADAERASRGMWSGSFVQPSQWRHDHEKR